MAIVKLNPHVKIKRGAMGNLVLKHYGDKVVLTRKPVFRNRIFSAEQKECHERFRQAALYAKQLMADPPARAVYEEEARVTGKPARSLIIRDFLKAYSVSTETVSKPMNIPAIEKSDLKKRRRKDPGIAEVPVAPSHRQLPIMGDVIPAKFWNTARVHALTGPLSGRVELGHYFLNHPQSGAFAQDTKSPRKEIHHFADEGCTDTAGPYGFGGHLWYCLLSDHSV